MTIMPANKKNHSIDGALKSIILSFTSCYNKNDVCCIS